MPAVITLPSVMSEAAAMNPSPVLSPSTPVVAQQSVITAIHYHCASC